MKTLHFTLGPVQGFVAQARRTRDLWAGSFLLSWLSAQAMKAVREQGGDIIFPAVTDAPGNIVDPMLRAVCGDTTGNTPQIGSIPNRFKASVNNDFDPKQVEDVVIEKWQELAKAVYEQFVKDHAVAATYAIWNRQINHFWEINWMLGDDPGDSSDDHWLDMRKNWRNHWPKPEGGDHCTVMGDYQELSGYVRLKNKAEQVEFWKAIREAAPDDYLDIRENERLCAIALVKRLFPRLDDLETVIGWIPGGHPKRVGNWPSTTYMAVAPWLARIDEHPDRHSALNKYACTAKKEIDETKRFFKKLVSEQATHLTTLPNLNAVPLCDSNKWTLSDMDGDLLHIHALRNFRTTFLSDNPLDASGKDNDTTLRETLTSELTKLYAFETSDGEKIGKPRSCYALLLMDGDSLGTMLQEQDQTKVSQALLAFTRQVPRCVDDDPNHGGVTIYAGGDDVFALLPMDRAIACAQTLRQLYGRCFADKGMAATASCAIIYAHHQVPLRSVIREAHHQLDTVAKEGNGRDSLALAVFKPAGVTAQWVSAWQESPSPVDRMQELIGVMAADEKAYPRGFFHKLRDRYGLSDTPHAAAPGGLDTQKLLVAEYLQTRDPAPRREDAERAIERLETVCRPLKRDASRATHPAEHLQLDGGFIARFLTQEDD